jgi:hypothetical protein
VKWRGGRTRAPIRCSPNRDSSSSSESWVSFWEGGPSRGLSEALRDDPAGQGSLPGADANRGLAYKNLHTEECDLTPASY